MATKRSGLGGGGLDQLFGSKKEVVAAVTKGEITGEVKVEDLTPNPYQPRKDFDPAQLEELIASIKEHGVIQPLIVRQKGKKYEIVAGERRWRAAKEVGLTQVPAVVRKYDEQAMMEVALIENMQRSDLNPVEEAEGVRSMMDKLHLNQNDVAKKLGKSRASISVMLRMLKLPEEVLSSLSKKELSLGQVKPLLALAEEDEIQTYVDKIVQNAWTARKVEEIISQHNQNRKEALLQEKVGNIKGKKKKKGKKEEKNLELELEELENRLTESFSTKVKITPLQAGKGKIVLEYYSLEELERLYEQMLERERKSTGLPQGAFNV